MPRKTTTKSEFVSAAGTAFKLVQTLSNAVDDLGGSDDDLRRILSEKSLTKEIAELLVRKQTGDTFPLAIDYSKSLAEAVSAGNYNYANPDITEEHFPAVDGDAEVETVLVHLDRTASDEEVLREMERLGLRPATMRELLAFGQKFPELQREYPIVALGSVWRGPDGDRDVGCLYGDAGNRGLRLDWLGLGWFAGCRFLGARK